MAFYNRGRIDEEADTALHSVVCLCAGVRFASCRAEVGVADDDVEDGVTTDLVTRMQLPTVNMRQRLQMNDQDRVSEFT